MSSAFVKEGEYQQLKEVTPNMSALLLYLRRENGVSVREVKSYDSKKHGRELHEMSDGLTYALNADDQWTIILDV